MFKLLAILGSASFISTPVNSAYQNHQRVKNFQEIQERNKENNERIEYVSEGNSEGRKASISEILEFDYLVPNWEWFTKLNSAKSFGYADRANYGARGTGLCEFISMSMLLEYQELFVSSGFFSDSEWEQYFENIGEYGIIMPTHKYYTAEDSVRGSKSGIPERLQWSVGATDLWLGSQVGKGFNSFLSGKEIHNKTKQDWSASWAHSSKPSDYIVKEKVPVMFSFVIGTSSGHNVTIFGYNSKTNELAIHYGWSDNSLSNKYSTRIIKQSTFWSFWSAGFWNTLYVPQNNQKKAPRAAFKYEDNYYSWNQLESMGKKWTDVREV